MASPNGFLVIADDLRVTSLIERVRPVRWMPPADHGGVVTDQEPALPRSDSGVLTPGAVYPSSDGSATQFYVPTYTLSVADGRYLTSLHWRSASDDPNGPIAFLTVVLAAVAPPANGPLPIEVDHVAVVRLIYDVAVSGADGEVAQQSIALGALMKEADGQRTCRYAIHEKGDFDRIWDAMTDPAANGRLEVHCSGMVARRTWRQIVLNPSVFDQVRLLDESSALVTRLIPIPEAVKPPHFEPIDPPIDWPIVDRVVDRPIVDRLVDRPIVDRLVDLPIVDRLVDRPIVDRVVDRPEPFVLRRQFPEAVRFAAPARDLESTAFRQPRLADPAMGRVASSAAQGLRVALLRAPRGDIAVDDSTVFDRPDEPIATVEPIPLEAKFARQALATVFRPDLGGIYLNSSDAVFAAVPGIPFQVIAGSDHEPATLRVMTTWTQELGFSFDLETNAYMFDVPGDLRPTTSHVLLPAAFDPGGGRTPIIYYQDSALPTQFSYEPQEFLIPRSDTAPYLPALQLAFLDVVSATADEATDGSGAAETGQTGQIELRYRVRMAYRLVASIDRFALAELQRHVSAIEPGAQLHVLFPEQASLSLFLPRDAASGEVVEEERPVADVTFDDGILDEVDLSPSELDHVIAQLQSTGVLGHVDARLVGSSIAHLPVRLSLHETTGPIFGRAYRGPVGDDLVRVSVQNRIESPVRIDEMYRAVAGASAMAYPQSPLGLVVPPNGSVDLDYRVEPSGADVSDVDPVLRVSVQTDLPVLLPQLMVNRGYASETFELTVAVDASVFGQVAPNGEVLTALRVEFEGDASTLLDPLAPSDDVQLRIPMLARLLRLPEAKSYRFRVVNVHGAANAAHDGASAPWTDGEGEGILTVTPVVS